MPVLVFLRGVEQYVSTLIILALIGVIGGWIVWVIAPPVLDLIQIWGIDPFEGIGELFGWSVSNSTAIMVIGICLLVGIIAIPLAAIPAIAPIWLILLVLIDSNDAQKNQPSTLGQLFTYWAVGMGGCGILLICVGLVLKCVEGIAWLFG